MKNILSFAMCLFLAVTAIAQDDTKTKKTHFDYEKSFVSEGQIKNISDVKKLKEKDFTDDLRSIVIQPNTQMIVFSLGFMEKTIGISDEGFSLIDKQWKFKLRDNNFAFLVIGDDYAIITLEEDARTLVLVNSNFKFK